MNYFTDYVKACNGISQVTITVEQVLALRQDTTNVYFDFIEYFLSAVVGKKYYKKNRCVKLLSKYATVADEALAILIFANNLDTWKDMARNNRTKKSTVPPKYTNEGSSSGGNTSSIKYQGWFSGGLLRFNEIFDLKKCASQCVKSFE